MYTRVEKITKSVYCTFQIEGVHNWENCPHEEVAYLRDPHRHVFHFKAWARVYHDDRDIEFIMMKHCLEEYIREKYYDVDTRLCYFGSMSCEMLGQELLDNFAYLHKVDVSEDNENGAIIERITELVDSDDLVPRAC